VLIDSLVIALGLDSKGVKKGISEAEVAVSRGLGSITNALRGMLGPITAAVGIGAVFTTYLKEADAIGDFAERVGESVEEMDAWGQAVVVAGGEVAGFQGTITALTKSLSEIKNLGTGRAKAAFEELGISTTNAEGGMKSVTEIMMEMAAQAETMDKMEFIGLAQKAGFDSGTANLLSRGSVAVGELVGKMKEFSYTGADAEAAGNLNDSLMLLKKSFMMVASEILKVVLPALTWLSEKFTDIFKYLRQHKDFVLAFFAGLATVITARLIPAFAKWAATMLANPITWIVAALLGLALVIEDVIVWVQGGESALGDLWTALLGSPEEAKYMWKMFTDDLRALWDVVKNVWGALKLGFSEFADGLGFIKGDITAVAEAISAWDREFTEGLRAIKEDFVAVFTAIGAFISETIEGVKSGFTAGFEAVKATVTSVVDAIKSAFQAAFEAIGGFVDTYIIGPINKVFGLVEKAKNFILGEDEGTPVDVAANNDWQSQSNARAQARWAAKQAAADVGDMSSAALSPPGGATTINDDHSTETTVNVAAINVTSSDPMGAGNSVNKELTSLASKSERAHS
jgi:hypothetical protein